MGANVDKSHVKKEWGREREGGREGINCHQSAVLAINSLDKVGKVTVLELVASFDVILIVTWYYLC